MKINDVKQLTEMSATKICPKCGQPSAKGHYWYKGEMRCKGGGKQDSQSNEKSTLPAANATVAAATNPPPAPKTAPTQPVGGGKSQREGALKWLTSLCKEVDPSEFKFRDDDTIDVPNPDVEVYLDDMHVRKFPVKWGVVAGTFLCSGGVLQTLENGPQEVGGDFHCNHNELTNFEGGPKTVGGECILSLNPITSLLGIPSKCGAGVFLDDCSQLKSLQDIHKHLKQMNGELSLQNTELESHMLGVLLVRGLKSIKCVAKLSKIEDIINKHLKTEERDMIMCQQELIDAGFAPYAKL